MRGFLDNLEAEWQDAVIRWRDTATDFMNAKARLEAAGGQAYELGPEEYARWLDKLDYANRTQTAIEMLQESLAATSTWAKRTLGLGAIARMGAIPLIPVAVITGSIATLITATYAISSYVDEMQNRWNYINNNPQLTPAQVQDILQAGGADVTGGMGDAIKGVGNMAAMIVVGGLLLYFGPMLLAAKGGKR